MRTAKSHCSVSSSGFTVWPFLSPIFKFECIESLSIMKSESVSNRGPDSIISWIWVDRFRMSFDHSVIPRKGICRHSGNDDSESSLSWFTDKSGTWAGLPMKNIIRPTITRLHGESTHRYLNLWMIVSNQNYPDDNKSCKKLSAYARAKESLICQTPRRLQHKKIEPVA